MRSHLATFGLTGLLVVWGLMTVRVPEPPLASPGPIDTELFRVVVQRVRAGESYYQADTDELRARGYATSSVFNWRLPTLTIAQAALPSVRWSVGILTALGLATAILWFRCLEGLALGWRVGAVPFLMMTLPVWSWMSPPSAYLHDLWAGQLIAISLACYARGLRGWSVAAGLAAVSIRELALPYVLLMAAIAAFEHRRREALGWLVACAASFALLAWHAAHVMPLRSVDPLHRDWLRFGGWRFALRTARVNVLLMLMPTWGVAILVPLAWAGLAVWRMPGIRRVAITVSVYLAMFIAIGRPTNWYWGLLIAPLLPLGFLGWISLLHETRPRAPQPLTAVRTSSR